MKITKYEHACLLVEMPDRTALFDPGQMSASALDVQRLVYLDDIIITHKHSDHIDVQLLQKLVAKFPNVKITSSEEVVRSLSNEGITASCDESNGIVFFDAPHEAVEPMFESCEQVGVHYLSKLTHPGDSHSFSMTMPILALPVDAPWGAATEALRLALSLKPKYVIPIHDWFWTPEARKMFYGLYEQLLAKQGIEFIKPVIGKPFNLSV